MSQSEAQGYDDWHSELEADEEANAPWHRLARRYIDPTRDLIGRTVLEIGCGRGGFAVNLGGGAERPAKIVGADFSLVALKKAARVIRKNGGSQTSAMGAGRDILSISYADSTFDTVFSFDTVEHVDDPARAVGELARVLRPGGHLFLTTPNYFGTMGLYRAYLWMRGREFRELGQPINQLTMIPRTLYWLAAAQMLCISRVRCEGHYLRPSQGQPPIHLSLLERFWPLEPFALHSFFLAQKIR